MVKKTLTRYDNIIIFNDFRISFTLIGLSVRFVLNILQSLIYMVHILGVMVDDCKNIIPVLRRVPQELIRWWRGFHPVRLNVLLFLPCSTPATEYPFLELQVRFSRHQLHLFHSRWIRPGTMLCGHSLPHYRLEPYSSKFKQTHHQTQKVSRYIPPLDFIMFLQLATISNCIIMFDLLLAN